MAKTDLTNNENIHVKVDQNNLIYIDPNSIVDKDGNVQPRGVKQENLIIYANLEADIVPRSILVSSNDQNTLLSIAKGTLNFLSNQNGDDYDSTWTEAYTNTTPKFVKQQGNNSFTSVPNLADKYKRNDDSGQSFGIDSINVTIKGANSIPQVTINFIDVRGKTLFEGSQKSPYNAFFHIPWPIFYLTLKGFYGKAIRYRLHLVKFSTKFNESNGNFEVSTVFVGSTYAFLNDITLKAIMNSPYMILNESVVRKNTNEKNQTVQTAITPSSRGYAILKNIFSEYKKKKLVKENLPVITLRELIVKAQSLDKLLEREILYNKLHPDIFIGIQDFEEKLNTFYEQVKSWSEIYLANNPDIDPENGVELYNLKTLDKNTTENIVGDRKEGTLDYIITTNNQRLQNSKLFADELVKAASAGKTGGADFKKDKLLAKFTGTIEKYKKIDGGKIQVKIRELGKDLDEISKVFIQQKEKLEANIEEEMNRIIKENRTDGLGFEPTIRNIFAIILANADVYIRLMKEVHENAFKRSKEREKYLKGLSKETKGDAAIYPWPEIKKDIENQKSSVIAYPGEKSLVFKLKSDDPNLWPEVDFIESFIEISTNKLDTNVEKENSPKQTKDNYPNDDNSNDTNKISTLNYISDIIPYIDKTPASFLYEIFERANYYTMFDSFDADALKELAELEFENIKKAIEEDNQLITILNTKVSSEASLIDMMKSYSPFERYAYYKDELPTIPYIKNTLEFSHEIVEYNEKISKSTNGTLPKLANNLNTYQSEDYRTNIYPFNSATYLSYLGIDQFTKNELQLNGVLTPNLVDAFITSPNNPSSWVQSEFVNKNIFSKKLKINNTEVNILNTPYFHKQLYDDFNKTSSYGKYVGSAYLLLTSLPFLDLDDKIEFADYNGSYDPIRLTTLFREVSATHYVPYHLMCKWGAIYHRYKKYITEGVDILDGFLNASYTSTRINGSTFFNNDETDDIFTGFTSSGDTITYTEGKDVGIHPYYDALYHQVVNGYNHYDVLSGNTSYSARTQTNAIVSIKKPQPNNLNYWTSYVDNSKYDVTDLRLTILPCDGANKNINKLLVTNLTTTAVSLNFEPFSSATQNYFSILWEDYYINDAFENRTLPNTDQYFKSTSDNSLDNNIYAVDKNYKKVIDLIATFSPKILDDFENIFLDFASEKLSKTEVSQRFPNIDYSKFQTLLNEIVSVKKESTDDSLTPQNVIVEIKKRQNQKLQEITDNILSRENTLKFTIGNSKEIDNYNWYGFAGMSNVENFVVQRYFSSQLTDENKQLIKLYLGEDIDLHYQNFFEVNDIGLTETNILQFRPLIQIYAGYVESGQTDDTTSFQNYIKTQILEYSKNSRKTTGSITRRRDFLNFLTPNFAKLQPIIESRTTRKLISGHENEKMKLELYNTFKSFNDKWIGGNSIGQRLLLEEFLFLDKANKDIGDKLFLNLSRLTELNKQDFDKTNLYSIISILIKDSGIDMRPLPSYINFYGNEVKTKNKITPSKKLASDLFGTFLDVDYQDSTPKIILQLVGQTSKHLDIPSSDYRFKDDSFSFLDPSKNPILITTLESFGDVDLAKSNRAVAFEVSFGDQNQGIFKGVTLDQTSLRNTTESFAVLENLARSESGAGAYNVDISLFDYYRQASYTCDVTCMGNAMIQPTMFFYLKNIPMFKGSYWITEVTHQIRGNNFTTTFKGTRIPQTSLPDPRDSFISSYRVLFDKMRADLIKKQTLSSTGQLNLTSTILNKKDGKTYRVNIGQEAIGEDFEKIKVEESGYSEFGVPYNGYKNVETIQLIKYTFPGEEEKRWFRARVYNYGSTQFPVQPIDRNMFVVSKLKTQKSLKWNEISGTTKTNDFYSLNFVIPGEKNEITHEKIFSAKTTFVNPEPETKIKTIVNSTIYGSEGNRKVNGPIDNGIIDNFGIGLSESLMKKLQLQNGGIVYFRLE